MYIVIIVRQTMLHHSVSCIHSFLQTIICSVEVRNTCSFIWSVPLQVESKKASGKSGSKLEVNLEILEQLEMAEVVEEAAALDQLPDRCPVIGKSVLSAIILINDV